MSSTVLDRIRNLLEQSGLSFQEVTHQPTYTSEQSAAARGEALDVGAKALVVKVDDTHKLFVLPANRQLDSRAVKRQFGARKVRFATADELRELTGLVPGSVPPFGQPILPFELYADLTIGEQSSKVAFNAGSLTTSIIMDAVDWLSVAKPSRSDFSKSD